MFRKINNPRDPASPPRQKIPWIHIATLTATWTAFSWALHQSGATPSAPFVLFPRERFYLYQAAVLPSLIPLTALAAHLVLPRVAGVKGAGFVHARAWAVSYVGLYLIPELVLFTAGKRELLSYAFLFALPIANLALFALVYLELRRETSKARALLAAFTGVVMVGLFLTPVVR